MPEPIVTRNFNGADKSQSAAISQSPNPWTRSGAVSVTAALAMAAGLMAAPAAVAEVTAFETLLDAGTRRAIAAFAEFAPGTCTEADETALARYTVTSAEDDGGADTLRAAIARAARGGGGLIVFDEELTGATIKLTEALRPASNTIIDGGCRNVTITAAPEITLFILRDVSDVTIRSLRMERADLSPGAEAEGDAITAYGALDKIVIEANRFASCGDGCIDITRMTGGGSATVRRNLFQRHNKVMLIATCFAGDAGGCPITARSARFRVEVTGNVFHGTAQRHPKAYGPVLVHAVGNLVVYGRMPYVNGRTSAAYGMQASHGAEIVAEANAFAFAGKASASDFALQGETDERAVLRARGNWTRRSEGVTAAAGGLPDHSRLAAELADKPTFAAAAACIVRLLTMPEC